jgi:3-oxoacyl-[acyl-carrier-protein] synthase-3
MINYIFSGYGHQAAKYPITNNYIADAIEKGYLKGFSEARMAKSSGYQEYVKEHPDSRPFDYFVKEKMGFGTRFHVTPFPPTRKKLYYAETSLDLGVKAVDMALKDAGLDAREIDAWFISTVSPNQKAPGIAPQIKAHFVGFDNHAPTFSLTSGCAGFNINLERAIEYLQGHPEAQHVVVGHTETMSSFLTQRVKFVPFVTFGDAAGMVILSKSEGEKPEGVLDICNRQDLQMIDFVGVDKHWNLYMNDTIIKDRAIANIPEASLEVMEKSQWKAEDIDCVVPHQTGNAILHPACGQLGIPLGKLNLEAQARYGNVSGATVPVALSMLHHEERLGDGNKILCPMAGVGGNYGAFTYIVPTGKKLKTKVDKKPLEGKVALVLGASGTLGKEIALELIGQGANIIAHYNKNQEAAEQIKARAEEAKVSCALVQADFNEPGDVANLILTMQIVKQEINYFVNASGVLLSRKPGKVQNVNHFVPLQIFKAIFPFLKGSALFVGAAAEDTNVPLVHEFISARRALHGVMSSMSGEILKSGNYLLWYQPGVMEEGMLRNIDSKALYKFMLEIGQEEPLKIKETAQRIVGSLYIPKVVGTYNTYQNMMIVRRDGYQLEVDI